MVGSGIRKKPIPDPGSRGQKGTRSRIRNTGSNSIKHISLKVQAPASVFYTRFEQRRAIRRGGGGTQAHINPLPQGCNHHRNAHHARSTQQHQTYSLKSPVLDTSPQPSPPPRAPAVPCPCFSTAWYQSVYMKSITKYAADHAHRIFFQSNVHCLYSLYVFLPGIQHKLLIYQIISSLHVYTLLKGHCIKRRHRHMLQIPVNIIHPHAHCLRFKGLIELFWYILWYIIESPDLSQGRTGVRPLSTTISVLNKYPPRTTVLFSSSTSA